jgi:hypothetical protein
MGRYFLYRMHPFTVAECLRVTASSTPIQPPMLLPDLDWTALWEHGGFPEPFCAATDLYRSVARAAPRSASDTALSDSLRYFQSATRAAHAFQAVVDLPYVDVDCFGRSGSCASKNTIESVTVKGAALYQVAGRAEGGVALFLRSDFVLASVSAEVAKAEPVRGASDWCRNYWLPGRGTGSRFVAYRVNLMPLARVALAKIAGSNRCTCGNIGPRCLSAQPLKRAHAVA